ncbi:hypothetical protein ACFL59_10470 [Planctomycetota bacterium]
MVFIERLIWVLAGMVVLGVVLVIALPALGIKVGPSSISQEDVDYDFAQANPDLSWTPVAKPNERGAVQAFAPAVGKGRVAAQGGGKGSAKKQPGRKDGANPAGASNSKQGLGSGGGPGLKQSNSGGYLPEAPTVYLPNSMAEKYRHIQDGMEALNSAESWDVDYHGQTAIQVGNMYENSPLRKYLGLQPGDIVVSINGYAVSRTVGRDLYNQLKSETKFRVEIDRGGSRFMMSYEIR